MELPKKYSEIGYPERRMVREEYVRLQDGKCLHCGEALDHYPPARIADKVINWKRFPPNFLKYPVHLHHSHKTDLTLGAVHAYCNAVLWQYHGE